MKRNILLAISALVILSSCTTSGPGFFGRKSPHQAYGDKLKNAGLDQTALGRQWFRVAEQSLANPLQVEVPYKETGYFAAEHPKAIGLRFAAKRGEKIKVALTKNPASGFLLYLDLWQPASSANASPTLLASADTADSLLEYEVKKEGIYQLRLQPELLKAGDYTITITNGPSLGYPVATTAVSNIGSFWGANRDGGARRHEGIDIFAKRGTPVVAAAAGTVGAVNNNNLGGKVVWLRPEGKDINLYYAHLDEQLVQPGQRVKAGDTLGLMGNTGNAKSTAPHLHFGIYAAGGAVDPLPFVNRNVKAPPKIAAPVKNLNKQMKTTTPATLNASNGGAGKNLPANTLVTIQSAAGNQYKVWLPDGSAGFISSSILAEIEKPFRKANTRSETALLHAPDTTSPRKAMVATGKTVEVLAGFEDYLFVTTENTQGWVPKTVIR